MDTEKRLEKLERELFISGRSKGSSPCWLPVGTRTQGPDHGHEEGAQADGPNRVEGRTFPDWRKPCLH